MPRNIYRFRLKCYYISLNQKSTSTSEQYFSFMCIYFPQYGPNMMMSLFPNPSNSEHINIHGSSNHYPSWKPTQPTFNRTPHDQVIGNDTNYPHLRMALITYNHICYLSVQFIPEMERICECFSGSDHLHNVSLTTHEHDDIFIGFLCLK